MSFSASDAAACTLAEQVLQPSHPERPCMLQFKPCASGLVATDVMCPILASCQSLCHSTPKHKDMLNTVACMHTGLLKGLQYHSPAPHAARPRYITVPDAQLAQGGQHQPGWLPCACCTRRAARGDLHKTPLPSILCRPLALSAAARQGSSACAPDCAPFPEQPCASFVGPPAAL